MLRVDPADRPTIEELKEYKWFDGIDWEEITYGPSAKRKCIYLAMATIDVLMSMIGVYRRQLRAIPRVNQQTLLDGLLYILPGPQTAAIPCGREDFTKTDGHVRARLARLHLPAATRA